jgi:hypothetical protein
LIITRNKLDENHDGRRDLEAQNDLKGKQAHVRVSDCVEETARADATFPGMMLMPVDKAV